MHYDGSSGWASAAQRIDDHKELPDFFKLERAGERTPKKSNMVQSQSQRIIARSNTRNSVRKSKHKLKSTQKGKPNSNYKKYPFTFWQ